MMFLLLLSLAAAPTDPHRPGISATPLFRELARDGRPLPGRVSVPKLDAAGPEPGDTVMLWVWNMTRMPPVQFRAPFVCLDRGNHCYVMVHDSVLAAGLVDSADAARIVERFERTSPRDSTRGVWQHNTEVLGQPPDEIDNDSLIYLIYYDIGTFGGTRFNGFWMMFDQYYDSTAQRRWGYRSNEIECVYLDCHPDNPAGDYRVAIAAHEFGHMIHWNYDPAESLWVQEGACELAMWLFGAPDEISGFPGRSNNDLTRWTGSWADYIKVYLFFLYLYEQHGGRVGTNLVHDIIRSTEVSIAGVQAGLDSARVGPGWNEVFSNWVLANLINDTTFLDGRYGYYGERVPRFNNAAVHYDYPVERTRNLDRWAGEYVLFAPGGELEIEFEGAAGGDFRLFLVAKDTIRNRLRLDSIPLDSLQRALITIPGADSAWDLVWLVPVNHYPHGAMNYRYRAAASGVREEPGAQPAAEWRLAALVRGSLRLPRDMGAGHNPILPGESGLCSKPAALLIDVTGRRVMDLGPGENDVSHLAPGVYFVRSAGALNPLWRVIIAR